MEDGKSLNIQEKKPIRGFRRRKLGEDGQAMIEFVITFPWVLFITLAVMQFALMWNAKNVCDLASFMAARSATVWVPRFNVFGFGGAVNLASQPGLVDNAKRYMKVHIAAATPLAAVSPRITNLANMLPGGTWLNLIRSLYQSLPASIANIIGSFDRFAYAYAAVSIKGAASNFPGGISISNNVNTEQWGTGQRIQESFGGRGDIVVQVEYYKLLEIPLINQFISLGKYILPEWGSEGHPQDPLSLIGQRQGFYFYPVNSYCRMPYEGRSRNTSDEPNKSWSFP